MILDIEQKPHELTCSYFNKEGIVEYVRIPVKPEDRFVWEICSDDDKNKDPEYKTWDNKPVKKIKTDRLNKYRVEELIQKYPDISAPLREFNMPRKYFVDIEVEVLDGFPDPETAQNKVTAISIAGMDNKIVQVFGLKELSEQDCLDIEKDINDHFSKYNEKWSFRYKKFESEFDLLYDFFHSALPKFPCISGWNFTGYDWKYLLNRAAKYKTTKPSINPDKCSPSGKLLGKNRFPQHRLIVDYMEIYKKWDKTIKIRENDKLDYVGKMACGIEKIKYPGSFKDLYEKDFKKFVFYNAVDSVLVCYIDVKLNTMTTYMKLAHISGVEVKKAFSPIWIMEGLMCREFLKRKQVFIYSDKENSEEQKAFDGAYVKEPIVGFHNLVTCFDFASLYPSVMRQFNISPESFVGNNVEATDSLIKVGERTDDKGKTTWRTFDNSNDSVLRLILNEMYAKRKYTKGKYLSINKEIEFLEKSLKQ